MLNVCELRQSLPCPPADMVVQCTSQRWEIWGCGHRNTPSETSSFEEVEPECVCGGVGGGEGEGGDGGGGEVEGVSHTGYIYHSGSLIPRLSPQHVFLRGSKVITRNNSEESLGTRCPQWSIPSQISATN